MALCSHPFMVAVANICAEELGPPLVEGHLQNRLASLPAWLRPETQGECDEPSPIVFGDVVTLQTPSGPKPCTPVLYLGNRVTAADGKLL
eukprot:SAG31_NODE_9402_length_1283_cov_1.315034_1_plen_89_part_01